MGPACQRLELYAGDQPALSGALDTKTLVQRGSPFAMDLIVYLVGPVVDIGTKREGDGSTLLFQYTFQEGDIALFYLLFTEQAVHPSVGFLVQGDYEKTGGIHVEAVGCTLQRGVREKDSDPALHRVDLVLCPSGNR